MKGIRIYIEGGGDSASQKAELRRGFQEFLNPLRQAVRTKRLGWDVIVCGGRGAAYGNFCTGVKTHPESTNVLLVDAEGPVAAAKWPHLNARDAWADPGVGEECCHLMVQTVEAWLLADPECLEQYYGQGFHRNRLPANPNVEAVAKSDVLHGLEGATRDTQKGAYHKIKHCATLLARLSPEKVQKRAQHCKRLFDTVAKMIADPPNAASAN